MADMQTNSKVDAFIGRADRWQEAFARLRAIALSCGLTEEFKWGKPCYALENRNIVLIHGFKDYCALLFFKGALMEDPQNILIQQTENVQAARQIRFTDAKTIVDMEPVLTNYVRAAIMVEQSGQEVTFKKTAEFAMPEEFQARLDDDAPLQAAFSALTPGRQRAYLLHFSSAKQAKTRIARIEKSVPDILEGRGLDD